LLPANPSFESQVTNLALGKHAYQSTTGHGGVAGRAVDGNTMGVWSKNSVTHTGRIVNPYWEVNLENECSIDEVYFWNRIDCCRERLSNIRVDVFDKPYGDVVETRRVEGQGGIMNVVDFGGISGQIVRITLETGDDTQYLSLAEVQVLGTILGPPLANQMLKVDALLYDVSHGTHPSSSGGIGHFDNGDYLGYRDIDFGTYGITKSILLNHSKGNWNGKVEVRLDDPEGQLIGTFFPDYTGGWDKYTTSSLSINATEGVHDVYFVAGDSWYIPYICTNRG
jgi:hypothetical protein